MATRVDTGELAVLSAGGSSILSVVESARIEINGGSVEGRPIVKTGESKQWIGNTGMISVDSHSDIDVYTRVSHLDLSAISIDGQSYATYFKSGEFSVGFSHAMGKAAGDVWQAPYVKTRSFSFNGIIFIPSSLTGNPAKIIGADMVSATVTNHQHIVTYTINSVATTLPLLLTKFVHLFDEGGLQCVEVAYESKAPNDTTAYPTASTGTTTLLEKAMNQCQTALAYQIDSRSAAGTRYSGNMVWNSARVSIDENNIIKEHYDWATQGAVTIADIV